MPGQKSSARRVDSMGETPAEARRRMQPSGATEGVTDPPSAGAQVDGSLTPAHMAAIREADEGFGGGPVDGGTIEDAEETIEPPTPSKAMAMIQQLGQDKIQLQTELDAALNVVARYRAAYGGID